jgi:S-(hydroxymethyl)glutathione dehydrogenase / alcohol dehydrogenase
LQKKTIAAILYQINEPLVVKEIEMPKLLPGQVKVKVFFSGVCRSQLMEARGGRGDDPWLPHLLGHEGSGEVIEIGEGVKKIKIGDKVILGWIRGEGAEAPGAKYMHEGQVINSGRVTTFCTHTIVSENRLVKLPANLPMDVAVLFGCAVLTGAGMVFNELKPSAHESIVVIGMGGIGLSALMALVSLKCKQIIAIDISDEKLELAKSFGATDTINSTTQDVKKRIELLTRNGADGCIESAGKVETIELGFSLIKKGGGRMYFASHPPDGQHIKIKPHELISGKKIFGSWGGACYPDKDIPHLAESFFSGDMALEGLITKRYSLNQINEALDDLQDGKVFRPLIFMEHSS